MTARIERVCGQSLDPEMIKAVDANDKNPAYKSFNVTLKINNGGYPAILTVDKTTNSVGLRVDGGSDLDNEALEGFFELITDFVSTQDQLTAGKVEGNPERDLIGVTWRVGRADINKGVVNGNGVTDVKSVSILRTENPIIVDTETSGHRVVDKIRSWFAHQKKIIKPKMADLTNAGIENNQIYEKAGNFITALKGIASLKGITVDVLPIGSVAETKTTPAF